MTQLLCLSGHAERRCLERGISAQSLEEAARNGTIVSRETGQYLIAHGRMRLAVSDTGMLITAWRMRRHNPKTAMRKARQKKIAFRREKERWGYFE